MSYETMSSRRPPGVLLLLCISLWCGLFFSFGSELIERRMVMLLEEKAPGLVRFYWVAVIVSGVGQAAVIWFLLKGHYWARVVMIVIVAFAGLAFVPDMPARLYLVMQQFQMAFKGLPDVLLSSVGMVGLYSNRTDSFWTMVYDGIKIGHMVVTVVCLFLPHVIEYCLPPASRPSGRRREMRSLY